MSATPSMDRQDVGPQPCPGMGWTIAIGPSEAAHHRQAASRLSCTKVEVLTVVCTGA